MPSIAVLKLRYGQNQDCAVTGQLALLADKPTRGQSTRGLVNSRTSNSPKCLI